MDDWTRSYWANYFLDNGAYVDSAKQYESNCENSNSKWISTSISSNSFLDDYASTYAQAYSNNNYKDSFKFLKMLIQFLNENEFKTMVTTLKERSFPEAELKTFLSMLLDNIHLSEDFLIENLDYLDKFKIKTKYRQEIQSRSYKRLALLLETAE